MVANLGVHTISYLLVTWAAGDNMHVCYVTRSENLVAKQACLFVNIIYIPHPQVCFIKMMDDGLILYYGDCHHFMFSGCEYM